MGIANRALPLSVLFSLAVGVAGAQEIDGELLFNQSFQGVFTDQTDVDLIGFQEAAGSLLTVVAQPSGNSGVKPRVELLDQSMAPLDTSGFESSKGKTFKIKKFPAPYTGQYFLRATSKNGQTGLYRVRLKGKPVKEGSASGVISAVAELDDVSFAARANSSLSGTIKRKSGDLEPLLVEVVGPAGAVSLTNKLKLKGDGTKLTFTGVQLPLLGEYALRLTGQSGTTGDYKVSFELDAPDAGQGLGLRVRSPRHPGSGRTVDPARRRAVRPRPSHLRRPVDGRRQPALGGGDRSDHRYSLRVEP